MCRWQADVVKQNSFRSPNAFSVMICTVVLESNRCSTWLLHHFITLSLCRFMNGHTFCEWDVWLCSCLGHLFLCCSYAVELLLQVMWNGNKKGSAPLWLMTCVYVAIHITDTTLINELDGLKLVAWEWFAQCHKSVKVIPSYLFKMGYCWL